MSVNWNELIPTRRSLLNRIKHWGSPTFSVDDIKDLPAIIDQWRGPSNAVSAFLWQSLSNQDQIVLTNYHPSALISNKAQAIVVLAINRIIGGPSIYESNRFQGISLRPETTNLMKEGPTGPSTARLNRLLLEDAYPLELSRNQHWDDQKSWEDFYQIYQPLIFGAAIAAGLTESEAEDVVSETTIAVAKEIGNFEYHPEKSTFKTWLHGIARHKVADQYRKRLGKGRVLEPISAGHEDSAATSAILDSASQVLDEIWDQEWERTLLDAAKERVKRKVRPAQFQIYDYHVLQEHSVRETTRALGVSRATVYLAKHRVGRQMRNQVAYLRTKFV
jgi:RNA polymerase sigma-70 factor (ECF subfamily)